MVRLWFTIDFIKICLHPYHAKGASLTEAALARLALEYLMSFVQLPQVGNLITIIIRAHALPRVLLLSNQFCIVYT